MLPPVLEIYVVWHPDDGADAQAVAHQFVEHFHGTLYSGLIGGAVEVFVRSEGWRSKEDAPRPIPLADSPPPNGVQQADLTAIVPVVGTELAGSVEAEMGAWHQYMSDIAAAARKSPERIGVFPLVLDADAIYRTKLGEMFGRLQPIAAPTPGYAKEPDAEVRCRDLAQSIAQLASESRQRLRVFISHTKRALHGEEPDVLRLIDQVRGILSHTRLGEFFDARDLQVGIDWDAELRASAATSAMLSLRTDLYASREWCQREVLISKQEGMPLVLIEALTRGEERGSFLMDHVPRIPVRPESSGWRDEDIRRALNVLVDECLKRELWKRQQRLAAQRPELNVAWWATHAPEPTTFTHWYTTAGKSATTSARGELRILHPDPPLGADEKLVLQQMASMMGLKGELDILTPRGLAARGA